MTYPTFNTICFKCSKKLKLANFNVHIGMHSFALCPAHLKELVAKYTGLWPASTNTLNDLTGQPFGLSFASTATEELVIISQNYDL